MYGQNIPIKTRDEVAKMRVASRHVAEILLELREVVRPGVTTKEIGDAAEKMIIERGVVSSFKGYCPHGMPKYPSVLCVSVNEEIVHGIPGSRIVEEGDIVSLDLGVSSQGYHGDSAVSIAVGELTPEKRRLMTVTREALWRAIDMMRPGQRLSDLGYAVQSHVEPAGFSVVRDFAGHGIGREMHEAPWIPNYGAKGRGPRLVPGMVFAIEPMVNIGGPDVRVLEGEWTAVTEDGSVSAHFEHTVLITEGEPESLTQIDGSH